MEAVMEAYMRHFVSQHLGKAIAIVECPGGSACHVRIAIPQLSEHSIDYAFELARVAQLVPEPAMRAETVARIAIHQAHKQFLLSGKDGLFEAGQELAIDTTPWVGDLEAAPYGGATAGYEQRAR
jgi:hypothetical protein